MVLLKALENAQADFNTMNGYLLATFTSHNFKLAVWIEFHLYPVPMSSNVVDRLKHGRTHSPPRPQLH